MDRCRDRGRRCPPARGEQQSDDRGAAPSTGSVPCLKILNKADLADPAATAAWVRHFGKDKQVRPWRSACKKPAEVARMPALGRGAGAAPRTRLKPLRMMIMGIPNVGKSTLMNALLKKRVAKVGDEPAVTKAQQTLRPRTTTWCSSTPPA